MQGLVHLFKKLTIGTRNSKVLGKAVILSMRLFSPLLLHSIQFYELPQFLGEVSSER